MDEQHDTYSAEEQRLAAALAARARTVTEADLRPPAPPGADRTRRRSPARWLPAIAAAAVLVAVFTLFVMIRPSEQAPPAGPSTPLSPSTPVSPSTSRSPSLPVSPSTSPSPSMPVGPSTPLSPSTSLSPSTPISRSPGPAPSPPLQASPPVPRETPPDRFGASPSPQADG